MYSRFLKCDSKVMTESEHKVTHIVRFLSCDENGKVHGPAWSTFPMDSAEASSYRVGEVYELGIYRVE